MDHKPLVAFVCARSLPPFRIRNAGKESRELTKVGLNNVDPIAIIRPFRETDFGMIFRIRNDDILQWQMLATPSPATARQVHEWLLGRIDEPSSVFFIASSIDGEPYGFVQLSNIDPMSRVAELTICIDPQFHGRGIGSEAIRRIHNHAAEVLNLRKIVLRALTENAAATSVYRKLGYTEVGVLKAHLYLCGDFRDITVMEVFLIPSPTPRPLPPEAAP